MTHIAAVCARCGDLYVSSPTKHERHEANAVTKANKIAFEHAVRDARCTTTVDYRGEEMKKTRPGLKELQAMAIVHADETLDNTLFLSHNVGDEDAVKILGTIKAALITAWAEGYRMGASR